MAPHPWHNVDAAAMGRTYLVPWRTGVIALADYHRDVSLGFGCDSNMGRDA